MTMKHFLTAAVALTSLGLGASADADRGDWHRRDQDEAFAARRAGQVMPLHQIEARIVPRMRGADYLGPDFDAGSGVYRLKFMRGGQVIFIDVDGRTGQVIGRSGY
jgi:uncharacterized membrane protein YkoI